MFEVITDSKISKYKKKTIASSILEEAWDEIKAFSDKSGVSCSFVVSQMIYQPTTVK